MPQSIVPILRARYPHIARELIAPLLVLIDDAERRFDGDLEKFHILLAVALRTAEHPDVALLTPGALAGGAELPSLWTNVHSISLSIGVPEETVRRKVRALIRKGWLERQDHALRYTTKAALELKPIRELLLKLAVANHATVAGALSEPGTAPELP